MSEVTLSLWGERPLFFINGDIPEGCLEQLDEELSYEVPDAQYTDAWKNDEWDGKHRLLRSSRNGNYYFPIGLLETVQQVLDVYGVGYEVEGLVRPGRGDMGYEWLFDGELRGYQEEAVNEALQHGSGTIVFPTGAGKTLVGLRLMYEIQRPTLVATHRKEIAEQFAQRIEEVLDVDVARCYGGNRESGDVQVALYQSVYQDGDVRDDVRLDHDVMILDEAHRCPADTFYQVALSCEAHYRIGLTATPSREDNAELKIFGGTGPIIADLSVEKLIEEGYLATPEWSIYEAPTVGGGYPNWQDEYRSEIVENSRRNQMIAQVAEEADKPCYIHVERVNHGERLEAMIDGAEFVYSETDERSEKIQAFTDGDVPVMISTLLGEGYNLPEMQSIIMAGGLKSSSAVIQKVGRALRPGESGSAEVIDFIDRGTWVGQHSEERIREYQDYYGDFGP